MVNLNNNFSKPQNNYLFSTISKKVATYKKDFPNKNIISLGIGDFFYHFQKYVLKLCKTQLQNENSPYIWIKIPDNIKSLDFFDILLSKANVVGTPGSGFGPSGEGYFRLTAFNSLENTLIAMDRLEQIFN